VLVRRALDDVRSRELRVVARCPYVKSWIERHPDYADLTKLDRNG
jgi:predicted GNAT family acetyltransferase